MKKVYQVGLAATAIGLFSGLCGFVGSKLERSLSREESLKHAQEHIEESHIYRRSTQGIESVTITNEFQNQLASKDGFKFEVTKVEYTQIPGTPQDTTSRRDFFARGTEYDFQISTFGSTVTERLHISGYDGSSAIDNSVSILITDKNNDQIPDQLYVADIRNNTSYFIFNNDGKLDSDGKLSAEATRTQFDYFTEKYQRFRQENNIAQRIREYNAKMTVTIEDREHVVHRIQEVSN